VLDARREAGGVRGDRDGRARVAGGEPGPARGANARHRQTALTEVVDVKRRGLAWGALHDAMEQDLLRKAAMGCEVTSRFTCTVLLSGPKLEPEEANRALVVAWRMPLRSVAVTV